MYKFDAIAKDTEYKSKICAMGVFRSHTPRAVVGVYYLPFTNAVLMEILLLKDSSTSLPTI